MKPEPLLAYALNGQPLTRDQGFPVRLIMPGWYGVANVKWLSEIHLQEDRYLGNFQARWYRNLRGVGGTGEDTDPGTQWVETEVTHMQLKSVIARVRKSAGAYQVFGFVLNDGTPLKSVEVSVDGGPWQAAALDKSNTRYSWKLFTFDWKDRHARRTHAGFPRHRRRRNRSTRQGRPEPEKDVSRRQRAVPAQNHAGLIKPRYFQLCKFS